MYRSTNCNTKFNETVVQEDQLVSLESETVRALTTYSFLLLGKGSITCIVALYYIR